MPTDNIIQTFVDNMEEGIIQVSDIRTVIISQDLHLNFEENVENILKNFEQYPLYQGRGRETFGPGMMPFYKKTIRDIGYDKNIHEYEVTRQMKEKGYNFNFRKDIVGIHQAHRGRPNVMLLDKSQVLWWTSKCTEREYWQ